VSTVIVEQSTRAPKEAHPVCFSTVSDEHEPLITLELLDPSGQHSLRALLDTGASSNFLRKRTLDESFLKFTERKIPLTQVKVRLATGKVVTTRKRVVHVAYTLDGLQLDDEFIVLDLDDKFDVILGMPWLRRHRPVVDWTRGSVQLEEEFLEDEDSHDARALVEGARGAQPLCSHPTARKAELASTTRARVSSRSTVSSSCGDTRNKISIQVEGAQPQPASRPQHQDGVFARGTTPRYPSRRGLAILSAKRRRSAPSCSSWEAKHFQQ
jgi:predicted aspartyl protease